MTQIKRENLIWIDLEMTGLNPEKEKIIEIAVIVTDKELNILAEGPDLVVKQPKKLLGKMDSWNKKQHKKSGLLDEVLKSRLTIRQAEKMVLEFIKPYCEPGKNALCGNSVYHDRRFIIKYMPKLDKFLHYRLVDVSTIKNLVQRWFPKYSGVPKKSDTHRALADIRESIEELRFYRQTFFKEPAS